MKDIPGPVSQRRNKSLWTVLVKAVGTDIKFGSFGGFITFSFWRIILIRRLILSRDGKRAIPWSDKAKYIK